MRIMMLGLAAALSVTLPVAAEAGHNFRNETSSGLRCRLSTDAKDTAMTIHLEPKERLTVNSTYRDVRCGGPVVQERFALADGQTYVFRRLPDGNRIGLTPE